MEPLPPPHVVALGAAMSDPVDPGIWAKAADWLWGVVVALLGLLYRHHSKRLDDLEAGMQALQRAIPSDFEREETTRQRIQLRDNQIKIFDRLTDMDKVASDRHIEIIQLLNKKADK